MKIVSIIFIFGTIYFFNVQEITNGQIVEYPNEYYEPIKFDYTLRGEFNITECMKELLTCYELVRGEVICHDDFHPESVCSWMRDLCHDVHGDLDIQWFRFSMFERYCDYYTMDTT